MSFSGLLDQSRQSFSQFWAIRNPRERAMLSAAAMVVTFGVAYLLLIAPALSGRNQLNKNLPELRQQVARMQTLATEAAALTEKNATGNVLSPEQTGASTISKESIEALLARNGLKAQSVMLSDDFVKVQLASVSFAGMLNWLDDVQKSARFFVIEANIVALAQPDMINAALTLRQPAHE